MYNRFQQYAPIDWYLPKTDLQSLAIGLESKQKRFDAGYEQAAKLGELSIDSLPQHTARANALVQDWQKKKDELVTKYDGDYAAAYRDIDRLARDIQRQMKPGSEAAAIITQKKVFQDTYEAMSKDKEANPEAVNQWYQYYMNPNSAGYIKELKQDPLTQSWGVTTPEQIVKWKAPDEIVQKSIDNLIADSYTKEYDSLSGAWKYRNKETKEVLSYNDVYNTVSRSLITDPSFIQGIAQSHKFRNVSFSPQDYVHQLADSYAKDYSYAKESSSQTMDGNEVWMHLDKQRKEDERQNRLLGGLGEVFNPKMGEMDYSSNLLGKDLGFDELIPGKANRSFPSFDELITDPAGSVMTGMEFNFSPMQAVIDGVDGVRTTMWANKNGKDVINTAITNGTFTQKGGNVNLMQAVLRSAPANASGNDLMKLYNEARVQSGAGQKGTFFELDPEFGKQAAQQLLLSPIGQMSTIRVRKGNGAVETISYEDFKKTYGGEIYKDDGTLKPEYTMLNSLVTASTGITPSFNFKVKNGNGILGKETTDEIFFEAPPAYRDAHAVTTALAQANTNPNGKAAYPQGANIAPYSYNEATGQYEQKSYLGVPIERELTFSRNSNGIMRGTETLYEYRVNPATGDYTKQKMAIKYKDERGNILERPIFLHDIQAEIDSKAFNQSFGTRTQDAKANTFLQDVFGNKLLEPR
jgi:hypothetical protein